MKIKLEEILKDIPNCQVKGSTDILISGISANSKHIAPGNAFIAKKGQAFDGRQFISEAIHAGASVIIADQYNPSFREVVQVIHPDIPFMESHLAAHFYRHPSEELLMVGITGTNGKTTTSFIVKNLLDYFQGPCGLIGTIGYLVGKQRYPATHTTPDVIRNHQLLREMVNQGCRSAVMEVTSHALSQDRVKKIDFDIAIFTNLTQDHLDYHQKMENYCQAKKKLFDGLGKEQSQKKSPKWAIVNQDSPWTAHMLGNYSGPILSYGIDQPSELRASHLRLEKQGTHAKISFQGREVDCFLPLAGRFNVYNCLAAMAVGLSQNISLDLVVENICTMNAIPGRLQAVKNDLGLKIYVDFAHTDDALSNVLATLKELLSSPGRLIVIFGCGGDRDRSKRPKMAKACEKYADLCIVTSDNPRSEEPRQICQEIVTGFTRPGNYEVEIDRREAIRKAIEWARPEDVILIAGKGHENAQIFADRSISFDDSKVAEEICAQLTFPSSNI